MRDYRYCHLSLKNYARKDDLKKKKYLKKVLGLVYEENIPSTNPARNKNFFF